MLSRVAVSLYVLGARLERLEHAARVLRVHADLSLENVPSRDDRFWPSVMGLLGWSAPRQVSRREAIERLMGGSTGPSLRRTAAEARAAAQAVRPSLSTDVFEQVNALHWRLFEGSDAGLHGYLRGAELGVQLISGLIDETMAHDEARAFLRLGRFVERGDATARLVTGKAAELAAVGDDVTEWGAALRCCCSFEAYRLRFYGPVTGDGVVGFLLHDRANPRSAAFCAGEALASLRQVDGHDRRGSTQEVLGELTAAIDRVDPESVTAATAALAAELARLRGAVEEALRRDYFLPSRPVGSLADAALTTHLQQQQQGP